MGLIRFQPRPKVPPIGFSSLPRATGAVPTSAIRAPTAITGLRPSVLAARTARGTCTSIQAVSARAATTVARGDPFVHFQNNRTARAFGPSRPADCVCDQH